jgi:voltage-gated potassium channel
MNKIGHRLHIRNKLNEIIFGTETPAGKYFDLILIYAILLSVLAVALDSVAGFHIKYSRVFLFIEWFFTLLFTLEYLTRIWVHPQPLRYIRSFYGIVDLLSILPTYISYFFPGANYLMVIRILRVLRIFRILKLMRYLSEANILLRSLKASRRKIFVFLFFVLALTTVFGSVVFIVEGPDNGFTSIPKCIYWAIVTITTVGYGDITPQTPFGQAIAALAMITGYSVIAVPTGIITAELASEMQRHKGAFVCKNCDRGGHDSDARHCKFCGAKLFQ